MGLLKDVVAFGIGIRRRKGAVTLDVTFPFLFYKDQLDMARQMADLIQPNSLKNGFYSLSQSQLDRLGSLFPQFNSIFNSVSASQETYSNYDIGVYFLAEDILINNPEDAYFKLQLISHRCVKPHQLNLEDLFVSLTNIVWTNKGPILPDDIEEERLKHLVTDQPLVVSHVDKFPYLLNYHVPSGVRIASGSQVRLGAYLGEGTTVMPAGYINFNAGTEGKAMVEGRISAGVFVSQNTDVGGGASIMGTLSGGGTEIISVGEQCLIGANAGIGISLGFGCTIAAGLYIYGGMKVSLYDENNASIDLEGHHVQEGDNVVKARDLSGRDHMLFIQDSVTGKVMCKPNPKTIHLNEDLHKN